VNESKLFRGGKTSKKYKVKPTIFLKVKKKKEQQKLVEKYPLHNKRILEFI
jgi:hypothetical protein